MTIIPDSLVVASDEAFSFIVPYEDAQEALMMDTVPDNFMGNDATGNPQVKLVADSLRGLKINEVRISARKEIDGKPCVRVMYVHDRNPNSTVRPAGGK